MKLGVRRKTTVHLCYIHPRDGIQIATKDYMTEQKNLRVNFTGMISTWNTAFFFNTEVSS